MYMFKYTKNVFVHVYVYVYVYVSVSVYEKVCARIGEVSIAHTPLGPRLLDVEIRRTFVPTMATKVPCLQPLRHSLEPKIDKTAPCNSKAG